MARWIVVSTALAVFALGLAPAPAAGQERKREQQGDWELSLSGTGVSDKSLGHPALGARATVSYFVTDWFDLSLRQTASYVKLQGFSTADFSTQFAFDLNLPLGRDSRWVVYGGANLGYYYGQSFSSRFEAAPEVGIKFFVNHTTFLFLQSEYQIYFSGTGGNSDPHDQQLVHTLGIGFRL